MGLVVTAHIANPDLSLTPTIEALPGATIRVVPHSTTDPETGMFFFQVGGVRFEAFETALDRDDTVAEWSRMAESETNAIYRISHPSGTKLLSPETIRVGGMMTDAHSSENGWVVKLQLPDREALSTLWTYCDDEDISFEMHRLYSQDEWDLQGTTGLTSPQREALVTAYEKGYFEEPRDTSQEQLADNLGISPTAAGGRLRRGMAKLIETTLITHE